MSLDERKNKKGRRSNGPRRGRVLIFSCAPSPLGNRVERCG
ncbi:hypothetical protein GTCCBUS3UF5_18300 [Geobacillus thermoleovorans CCB_US3_UF5]|uniref:Uncharacterized protein n=1 Tax=Geobacillus thermoleovorans CCB_US3_UF5 TaxID=1111068 RepID=A0ABM5MHN5_GEOTH|nr:hypothetical protein GTCCBUS3UF5_18300 [Geobacillus thermoleovorans CCB_US3_UF5]GAJ59056.1 hypothetical protein B23_2280 [Geobacillus thermoleovorans B23]